MPANIEERLDTEDIDTQGPFLNTTAVFWGKGL